jgi:hypothetical protein
MADRAAPGPADGEESCEGHKRRVTHDTRDELERQGKEARMAEEGGGEEGVIAGAAEPEAASASGATAAFVTPDLDPPCYVIMHSLSKK